MPFNHPKLCDDVTIDCISRIPIHYHRTLGLTSRTMRSFISKKDLFRLRSAKGITQHIIYSCGRNQCNTWYSLGLKPKKMKASFKRFYLMKIPMQVSYFPASSKTVATVGSKLFMMGCLGIDQESDKFTKLMVLNCRSHRWSVTSPMKFARKIKNLFCYSIKEKVYVLGGCEEEGVTTGPLNVKLEIFNTIDGTWESGRDLALEENSVFVLVGSSDGENLSVWSSSRGVAIKHMLDQTGMWIKKESGLFPSNFKDYTHTILVGKLIVRVLGTLLLWYDEEDSMEWFAVDGYKRLKSAPFNVVDNGGNLLAFGKVKSQNTNLWATEVHLRKAGRKVFASETWSDIVLKSDTNFIDFFSTCIKH